MTMKLELFSPWREPERIMLYGMEGSGKSNAVMAIAERMPRNRVVVLDNDRSPSYTRTLDRRFPHVENVEVVKINPDSWDDLMGALREYGPGIGKDDLLVVDPLGDAWNTVQGYYSRRVHGEDLDDFFIAAQMKAMEAKTKGSKSSMSAFEGMTEWPIINALWGKMLDALLLVKGHVVVTSGQVALRDEKFESKENTQTYARIGYRPAGQKNLGHVFSTVVWMHRNMAGEFRMTTAKDRDNELVVNQDVGSFATDYLVKVAGWKVRPIAGAEG